jgi:hypothetical protein
MKKNVQELHEQHKLDNSPVKLYLVHKFDPVIKSWKFDGYRCVHCGSTFKHLSTIEKHKGICKELNRGNKRSYGADDPELVITTDRRVWKPLDVNTS